MDCTCSTTESIERHTCDADVVESAAGPILFAPMAKGATGWTRPGHGWATTAGVLKDNKLLPTFDREGERMLAAERPGGVDMSSLVAKGFMNHSHRAVPAPGASCTCPESTASCAVHGPKQASVLIGIPDAVEYVDAAHPLADRDGKIGWYSHFHLIDRHDPNSWSGEVPRYRMLKDGTVTDEPFVPTAAELDGADYLWELGLKLQREGRTLGQSIQGREVVAPCAGGSCIVKAVVHQIALIEHPHNPDATVESLGREMAKGCECKSRAATETLMLEMEKGRASGVPPIVMSLATMVLQDKVLSHRYRISTLEGAIRTARVILRERRIFNE